MNHSLIYFFFFLIKFVFIRFSIIFVSYSLINHSGRVGLAGHSDWAEPFTDAPEDGEASKRLMMSRLGLFCNPICGDGDYSSFVKERFEALKRLGVIPGYMFMPEFSAEEKIRNKGEPGQSAVRRCLDVCCWLHQRMFVNLLHWLQMWSNG